MKAKATINHHLSGPLWIIILNPWINLQTTILLQTIHLITPPSVGAYNSLVTLLKLKVQSESIISKVPTA